MPTAAPRPASAERRTFLVWGVTTATLAVVVGTASRLGSSAMQAAAAARRAIRLPVAATAAPAVPAGASLDVDGITPYITPNADFYRIDTALRVPQVDPADWSLRIHGAVEQEVTLTWDELLALPLEEHVATLSCVSNEVGGDLIGTARWLGYPIRKLLARARPTGDADMVLSRSIDGFSAGTPLDVLQDDGTAALLAVGMNGEPLPTEHGFPVRMVVPGLFGYVSATKWVSEPRGHPVRRRAGLLDTAWLVGAWPGQARVPHRHPAERIDGDRGQAGGDRRGRVAAAQGREGRRGPRRRRRLAARRTRRLGLRGHVATVGGAVDADRRIPPHRGARDQCGRRGADERGPAAGAQRRDGLAHGDGRRALTVPQRACDTPTDGRRVGRMRRFADARATLRAASANPSGMS